MSRQPRLPETAWFPALPGGKPRLCFFRVVGYRAPRSGEYYVSGAIPEVYQTRNDLESKYWVVEPTHEAVKVTTYVRGGCIARATAVPAEGAEGGQ